LITQVIQLLQEEKKQRIITFTQNTAESFFRFASLASGAHQIYTRIEQLKDVLGAKAIKLTPYRYRLIEFRLSPG
jgi:hypothetical protein